MATDKKATIFYVEDDESLAFLTKDNLELKGYEVHHFADGYDASKGFYKQPYDICILDIMLPRIDGFTLARQIREKNEHIPILFLSAKSMEEDKLEGFSLGGDDYITKPFSIDELVMKIEVFLRRNRIISEDEKNEFVFGIYKFNVKQLELLHNDVSETLTMKEAELLRYFLQNKNEILKRSDILIDVWGQDDYFLGRSLDVFISRLRKYLADDDQVNVENIHGVGFRLNVPE